MRARNIKPGFFKNADLSEIQPLGRLLFIGLWCLADREGRLHDRPKQIKAEILPYDEIDCNKLVNDLQSKKFLERYERNGLKYILINNFNKHQFPHHREQASLIQAPGKPRACLGKAHLNPSILNPDILIPESLNKARFVKPSALEVTEYAKTISFDLDGQTFLDHYEANGWMRGKSKIVNWKAAVRTWKTRRKEDGYQRTNAVSKIGEPDGADSKFAGIVRTVKIES